MDPDVGGEARQRRVTEGLHAKLWAYADAALECACQPEPRADEAVHAVVMIDRHARFAFLARNRRVPRADIHRAPLETVVTDGAHRHEEIKSFVETVSNVAANARTDGVRATPAEVLDVVVDRHTVTDVAFTSL